MKKQLGLVIIAALCLYASSAIGYVRDPYKVLGVEKGADDAAVKRAYKKLALQYHPDKNPKGQAKFIEIQQAYEILSDADKKREYDLGGGAGGEYDHQRHQGSSRHHHHYHYHYQYQQQQEHYYNAYHQQQQQEQEQYERALPSNTSFLTSSNFRSLVIYGGRPWLIMFYTEGSAACRDFSPAWESLWKSLGGSQAGGGSRDGASVGLGRIHVRFQRSLVQLIARTGGPFSGMISEDQLPLLMAVPSGCSDTSCFVLYRGPLRLSAVQDFVADRLLQLPRVPQLEPQSVAAFLRRASPYKVVVVAFGRGGGSGSLALRSLAGRQKDMLTVARGHVQDSDTASAAAWQAVLGLSSPPTAGQLVFLRGPGTAPRTLVVPPGKAAELQQLIDEEGLLWQEVPPLRPATGASLGCLWGRAAAASGRSMIDTCVVLVAPRGPKQEEARRRMALLGRYMALPSAKRDPSMAAAASAYMDGKLRLVWLDASTQRPLCAWLMGVPEAMRPTNMAPPPGTNAAGRAAAVAQALAAAAARSPELTRAVCGPAPLDVLGRARGVTVATARAAGLRGVAAALQWRPAAHVVVIRPSVDGSSWFRGASSYQRHGRPVFLHAVNADFDMGSSERGLDSELPKLAAWINQVHSESERNLHASTAFPPALQQEDEQGAVEYVACRLYEGALFVMRFVMNAGATSTDGSAPLSSEQQAANLAVAVLALVLVQLAFFRRGDDQAARGRAASRRTRQAAATVTAAVATAAATTTAAAAESGIVSSQGRICVDSEGASADETTRGKGDDRGRDAVERAAPLNRRAISPSWRSGRRGDVRGSDHEEGSGGSGDESDGGGRGDEMNTEAHQDRSSPDNSSHHGAGIGEQALGLPGGSFGQADDDSSCSREQPAPAGIGGDEGSMVDTETHVSNRQTCSGGVDGHEAGECDSSSATKVVTGNSGDGTGEAVSRQGSRGGDGGGGRAAEQEEEDEASGAVAKDVGDGWLAVRSPRSGAK